MFVEITIAAYKPKAYGERVTVSKRTACFGDENDDPRITKSKALSELRDVKEKFIADMDALIEKADAEQEDKEIEA